MDGFERWWQTTKYAKTKCSAKVLDAARDAWVAQRDLDIAERFRNVDSMSARVTHMNNALANATAQMNALVPDVVARKDQEIAELKKMLASGVQARQALYARIEQIERGQAK